MIAVTERRYPGMLLSNLYYLVEREKAENECPFARIGVDTVENGIRKGLENGSCMEPAGDTL